MGGNKHDKHDRNWLYCQVTASASEDSVRPVHQLGSEAHVPFNVVCLWEWRGADSTRTLLRQLELDTKMVLIFFLGRLTPQQRRELAARKQRLVLDEILLVFLARENSPIRTFLRCSLPYAALNPYTPFRAGKVPPEMYYGRDNMAYQLQNENTCIVFGGRQLGKSALLRQVEREFHQPEQEQFAFFEDIKLVGDPVTGEQPNSLWIRLRDAFKKYRLIKSNVKSVQSDTIKRHIQDAMNSSPQRRVLVLFDEADHFLDADAQKSFQVVEGLRDLMQETRWRFKVVFAGLHDVQRFKNISNQPLAHFGSNLLVGPLEPDSARQLVQEPLEVLGYRFDNETTLLKILSYTNYHPGLIQYFCHELADRLQNQRSPSGPPYPVHSEDVEAVYRLGEVRRVIGERLDWTLALDTRYQCISWAMIYEQRETHDGYAHSFSVAELLQLAQEHWPQGFSGTDAEGLRSLLGEMVGLGILVRNMDNKYLLRSPNLVRLMGTVEDIETNLLELSEKPPPTPSQPSSQHRIIDPQASLYSPLTLVQEGRLEQTRSSGLSLVFGSHALGLARLNRALPQIVNSGMSEESTNLVSAILPQAVRAHKISQWLESYARKQRGADQLLAYSPLKGSGKQMASCIWEVLGMCKTFNQRRRRPLQVVFILDPEAVWSWLRLSADQHIGLEERADLIYLRRWDEIGIQQRLQQAEKVDLPEVPQKVLEATGGWPFLLDELFRRCGSDDDPRSCIDALVQEITQPESQLAAELLEETGLAHQKVPLRVLQTLSVYGKVKESELDTLSVLVEGDLALEDCLAAVEFLYRLGCIEKKEGEYSVEPVLNRVAGHQ